MASSSINVHNKPVTVEMYRRSGENSDGHVSRWIAVQTDGVTLNIFVESAADVYKIASSILDAATELFQADLDAMKAKTNAAS